MFKLPSSLEKLVNSLSKLPGIGPRSAQRLAFYMVKAPKDEISELAESITTATRIISRCEECSNITDSKVCSICSSSTRDSSVICVVENPQDVIAVESSGEYNGLYHVLMGSLSPLNGIGPEDLTIGKLISRIKDSQVNEVILATDPNVEGEATATYLKSIMEGLPVKVTRLARGIPIGGNLEYADGVTLSKAIEGRREF